MPRRISAIAVLAITGSASAQTIDLGFDRYRVESGVAVELLSFGVSHYLFEWTDSSGTFSNLQDPTLEIAVGQTYTFQRFDGSHPFAICDDTLPVSGEDGAYNRTTFNSSVINAATLQPIADFTADPGPTTDLITWTPTAEDVGTYFYTCTITGHPGMTGRIDVYDPNAEPTVHSFTAEIIEIQSFGSADLSDDFSIGQPVSGYFAINETMPDNDSGGNGGDFFGALVDFQVDVDSGVYILDSTGPASISALDSTLLNQFPQGDYVIGVLPGSGGPIDGVPLSDSGYTLADFSDAAFPAQDNESLSPTWDLNAFPDEGITISWIEFVRGGSANGGTIKIGNFTWTVESDCLADVNGDGAVTPTDFTAWINAFNNNLPECDQNGDNACTPTDFTAWINNFNAGC